MPPNQPFQPYQGPPMPTAAPLPSRRHGSARLIMALVVSVALLIGALAFGIWAFAGRQDYKNNSDQKAAKAVAIAIQQEATKKDNEFVEKEKSPTKTYQGPAAYGSLEISYPKTWAAYVVETDRASVPVDAYFHPGFVPGVQSKTAYALRVQVSGQAYDQEMKQFDAKVKAGKITVTPYASKNVPGVTGARLDGEINTGQKDSMVLLPLRDKTIRITTESQQFIGDFNDIILANFKFIP